MYLKTLSIKGFKSFADHATLDLQDGITVVVGPNGSGKSNVVDAIAWVLGAQAPSAVRSAKMEDVIFAGTQAKAALGRAEVSLTIDNTDGVLPIEFSEVTITRTLFRSGESDYKINGASCRLLDITELLSDSGVGRQQHIIVSQGQIDAVLNSRPEERRGVIEEAAGVLKYRKRKERAERRLASTEENLNRVADLVREVKRQLRPLEKQADAARRHGAVLAEATALRTYLVGRELTGLSQKLEAHKRDRLSASNRESELQRDLARLDALILDGEAELAALGGSEVDDVLSRARSVRERILGQTNVVSERRRRLEGELQSAVDEGLVSSLEAEAAQLSDDLAAVEADAQNLKPEMTQARVSEKELDRDRAAFEQQWGDGVTPVGNEAAEVRAQLSALESASERDQAEDSRLNEQISALSTRRDRLLTEQAQARALVGEDTDGTLRDDLNLANGALVDAEAALREANDVRRAALEELSRWEARADALAQALEEARNRAGVDTLAGTEGVLGTLLDLISVDGGWEGAVEAAASEALQAVLIESEEAARSALVALSDAEVSGAVLPLGVSGTPPTASLPYGLTPLRSLVSAERNDVRSLLDLLLAGIAAIEGSWSDAADLVAEHPGLTVVTQAGDRIGPSGWRLAGDRAGATGAAQADAAQRADAARTAQHLAEEAVDEAEGVLLLAGEYQRTAENAHRDHQTAVERAQAVLDRTTTELEEIEESRQQLSRQRYEISERAEADRKKLASLQLALPGLEADEKAHLDRAQTVAEARAALEEKASLLASVMSDLRARQAAVDERREMITTRRDEIEARLARLVSEREAARARREVIQVALDKVKDLTQQLFSKRSRVDEWLTDLDSVSQAQSEAARQVGAKLSANRGERQKAEKSLEDSRARRNRVDLAEAEDRVRLETLTESVRRDLDIEPETAMTASMPEVETGQTPEARLRDLDRELKAMGPINPLALEEFEELKERYEFLSGQMEDVKTSRRELVGLIREIDEQIVSVFASAYADVASNFTDLFGKLFPGGKGSVVLTDPDDLLNTGIEIEAKPSGKNVKKLSLLSGGERSLTALGFLFAVFRSRPSPFYVMDEVEAALDDFNLNRFLTLVQEFRDDAQLLIVSHQKRTMEAADVLYGVSMKPGQSSKVVSERVNNPKRHVIDLRDPAPQPAEGLTPSEPS
ncbi:MAG: chromosome segregation protein SMC [Acidimicrobiales bacterium]